MKSFVSKKKVSDWKKFGTAVKGIVNVGAVDATKEEELSKKFGVQGFPTILVRTNFFFFERRKEKNREERNGERCASEYDRNEKKNKKKERSNMFCVCRRFPRT